MAVEDQAKWDRQHASGSGASEPSAFLRLALESAAWHVPRGRALDIACGKGRNALYLADRGFQVVAMDISGVALAEGRKRAEANGFAIVWRQTDLQNHQLDEAAFDCIVNINYLQRPLIPRMKQAIKAGGHIIFETFLIDQKNLGHPQNPDYLLGHNELLEQFRDFRVLFYREGKFDEDGEASYRAGILAQRIA